MRRAIAFALASVTSLALAATISAPSDAPSGGSPEPSPTPRPLLAPGEEKFLANVRQLTFGGQNAEAYWSADGGRLIFQSDEGALPCDQIFTMAADGSGRRRISNGEGKTTCAYFFPDGDRVLYASTLRAGAACPPRPDRSRGYVWALDDYDIYAANADGTGTKALFASPAYDAEATISPDGEDDRLHVGERRRPRDLHDERRRLGSPPSHAHARLRRRPVLLGRREEDRLPGRPSDRARRPGALPARTSRGTRTRPGASRSAS